MTRTHYWWDKQREREIEEPGDLRMAKLSGMTIQRLVNRRCTLMLDRLIAQVRRHEL